MVEEVEFGGREWEVVLAWRWEVGLVTEGVVLDVAIVFRNSGGGI